MAFDNKQIQDLTGNSVDLNAALLQDTAERIAKITDGSFSHEPTTLGGGVDFTQGLYNPVDALISTRQNAAKTNVTAAPADEDPAFAAVKSISNHATAPTIAGGLTAPHKFDVTDEIKDKYIDNYLGYVPGADNEDRYAKDDASNNWFYNKGKHFLQFAAHVIPSVAYKSVDMLAATASTIIKAPYALSLAALEPHTTINLGDNAVSTYYQQVDKAVQDRINPVYQSLTNRGEGFWYRAWNDPTFYTQDLADGVAFFGSAFVTSALTEGVGLTGEAGVASKLGTKLASITNNLSRGFGAAEGLADGGILGAKELEAMTTGYIKNGQRFAKAADMFTTTTLNTLGEASMEARDSYTKVRKQLIDSGYSVDDAEKLAHEAYKGVFGANLIILGISNGLFETGIIRGTLGKLAGKAEIKAEAEGTANMIFDKATGQLHENNFEYKMFGPKGATTQGEKILSRVLDGRIGHYGGEIVKGTLAEGIWEENMQLAAQRYYEDANHLRGKNAGLLSAIVGIGKNGLTQLWGAAFNGDTEAGVSIGLGGGIGAFGIGAHTLAGKITTGKGSYSTEQDHTNKALTIYNKSINETFGDLYQTDKAGKYILDKKGNAQVDDAKMAAFIKDHADRLSHLMFADAIGNDTAKRVAVKSYFGNFLNQFMGSGIDASKVLDFKLGQYAKAGEADLQKLGFKNRSEFETFRSDLMGLAHNMQDMNESLDNDVKFSPKKEHADQEGARRNFLMQHSVRTTIHDQELQHFTTEQVKLSASITTNPILLNINELAQRIKTNRAIIDDPTVDEASKENARSLEKELVKEHEQAKEDNAEFLKDHEANTDGSYKVDPEENIKYERLQAVRKHVGALKNLLRTDNKSFYKYANSKDGFKNFENDILPKIKAANTEGQTEANGTIPPEEQAPIDPNAKRITIKTKDKKGNELTHELVEGETYLTDKDVEKKYLKGRAIQVYNHDMIKIQSINDDGTVTVVINNSGETVTLDQSDFSDIGKIWNTRSLSPLLQTYFANRDMTFDLNVGVFTNSKTGQKFTKAHQLDGNNYNVGGLANNTMVKARLGLRKDDEGNRVVKIVYKDPFTGRQVAIDYNEDYLNKYGNNILNINDFITEQGKKALAEQARTRDLKKRTQLKYINDLLNDSLAKLDEQKQRSVQNDQAIQEHLNKITSYQEQIASLSELMTEIKNNPDNADRRTNDKLKKTAREKLETTRLLITRAENDIAESERMISSLEEEHADIQKQLAIHQTASDLYFNYGLEIEDTNAPIDLSTQGLDSEEGYLKTLQSEDNRNSEEKLNNVLEQTNAEIDVINGQINTLHNFIDSMKKVLSQFRITEKFLSYFSKEVPTNDDYKQIRESISGEIKELEDEIRKEEDTEKIKPLSDQLSELRKILALVSEKGQGRSNTAMLSRIVNNLNNAKKSIDEHKESLVSLNEKKDRLMYALGVKEDIRSQTAKITAYKELQAIFMQKYKQTLIARNEVAAKKNTEAVDTKGIKGEYLNENSTEEFNKRVEDRAMSKSPLNSENLFKTAGRHYNEDGTMTDDAAQRFYYFTSEVLNADPTKLFTLLAIAPGQFGIDLPASVKAILTKEQNAQHIPLVVTKKVGEFYHPVGINGEVLTEEELKDPSKFIYSSMHNDADLLSGDDRRILDWAKKTYDTSKMADAEVLKLAKHYLAVKAYVQEELKKGNKVSFKINGVRPGVNNVGELRGVEEVFMPADPTSEDYMKVQLHVVTTGDTGGTSSQLPPGAIAIIKHGFANRVLDRNMSEEELDTVANAIVRVDALMGNEATKEDAALQSELTNLRNYLRGVTQWSVPDDGKKPNPQQIWFASGLHMGDTLITPANVDFETVRALLHLTDKEGKEYPIYHATNKSMVMENKEFVVPTFDKDGQAHFNENIWPSYKEYLLSSKDGRVAPLRTNTIVADSSKLIAKRRNAQITYVSPIQMETKKDVKPVIEQKMVTKMPWSDVSKQFDTIPDKDTVMGLAKDAGNFTKGDSLPNMKDSEYYKIFYPLYIDGEGGEVTAYNYNLFVTVKDGKIQVLAKFIKNVESGADVTNDAAALEQINAVQPFSSLDITTTADLEKNLAGGGYDYAKSVKFVPMIPKAGVTIKTETPAPATLDGITTTDPVNTTPPLTENTSDIEARLAELKEAGIELTGSEHRNNATNTRKILVSNIEMAHQVKDLSPTRLADYEYRLDQLAKYDAWVKSKSADKTADVISSKDAGVVTTKTDGTKDFSQVDFSTENSTKAGDDLAYRIASPTTEGFTKENTEEFRKWLETALPQVKLFLSEQAIDGRYHGQFVNGMINLFTGAEEGTGFHEAFEAVWNSMMSPAEQKVMLDEFKARKGTFTFDEGDTRTEINYADATNFQAKETIAEEFRSLMLAKKAGVTNLISGAPKRNNFFLRLWKALQALFSRITSKERKQIESKIESLFADISEGRYAEVNPAESFVKNNRPVKGYNVQQSANIINALHSAFFRNLIKAGIDDPTVGLDTLLSSSNSKLVNDTIAAAKGTLLEGFNKKIASYTNPNTKALLTEMRDNVLSDDLFYKDIWPLYKEYVRKFGLAFEQEKAQEDEEQPDINIVDKSNLQESVEVDSRNLAKGLVRILIAALPDVQYRNGNLVNTIQEDQLLDYNKSVNYGRILATLINDLSNTVPVMVNGKKLNRIDTMFQSLDNKYKTSDGYYKRGYEWISILKSRLGYETLDGTKLDQASLTEAQVRLKTAFESSFSNALQVPLQMLVKEDGDIYFTDAVTDFNKGKIRQGWMNNARTPLATAIIEKGGALVVNKEKITMEGNIPSKLAMLESIGIKTSITESILSSHPEFKKAFDSAVASIKATLIKKERKSDIKVEELYGNQLINGPLNDLAHIEVSLSEDANVKSFRNAEGRSEYSVVLPSTYSSVINSLNLVGTLEDFLATNPQFVGENGVKTYQRNSLLLNKVLFDARGNRTNKSVTMFRVSGMAMEKTNDGSSTKSLSFSDKLAQELNHLLEGRYYVVINSDKSSEYALDFGHFVNYGFNMDRAVREIYVPHLIDEMTPIVNYWLDKDGTTKVQYYLEDLFNKKLGHFADKVPSFKSTIDALITDIKNNGGKGKTRDTYATQAITNFAASKEAEIKKYILDNAVKSYQSILLDSGVVEKKGNNYRSILLSKQLMRKFDINPLSMTAAQFDLLSQFIVVNSEIAVAEQHKLIYGDPRIPKDLPKRANAANSTREIMTDNDDTIRWMNENYPRMDEKERKTGKPTFNVISYDEVTVMSKELRSIAESFFQEFTNRKNPDNNMSKEEAEKNIGAKFDENGKVVSFNMTKGTALSGYAKLTENDGQAYIMPDMYRDLLFLTSKLSHEQKELLDYLNAYERLTRSQWNNSHPLAEYKYTYTDSKQFHDDKAIVEKGSNDAILPTLKPQGFTYNANTSDLLHTTFLKNSVTPLFFKHVEDNPLALKQYLIAQKHQVDLLGSSSGQKMGYVYQDAKISKDKDGKQSIKGITVDNFKDGKINEEVPPIQELYTEYFGLQVEMAAKTKKQILRGSQITKLILGNIFEHGIAVNEQLAALTKDYVDNISRLTELGKESLMKKIGLRQNEDGSYETDNIEKLMKTLRDEAITRDMPDNVVEIFQVDPNDVRKMRYRFDSAPTRDRIEYMLMAMIDRSVISQKISGKMSVQVASTLHTPMEGREYIYLSKENGKEIYKTIAWNEVKNLSKAEQASVRMTSTDLSFYKDERGMEVYLPWSFAEKLGLKEGDISKVDPKLLKLIGYRIPTQSLGQAEYITIKGFLPKELGDIVVMPTEIVGKSGSDFDIDKLSLYLPNYYKDEAGNLTYTPSNAAEAKKVGQSERAALENKNIELMWNILAHPQNKRQHLTANSADTLKALEGEIFGHLGEQTETTSKTSLGQLGTMAQVRNVFIKAKELVGLGALQITSHTISQLGNITLSGYYKGLDGTHPVTIALEHNKNAEGQYSLAHVYSKDGKYISEILSEFLSGFVDAAKDPFVFNLNINIETAPAWFMLLKLSVPLETAAYFMNQPIIRNLIKEKDKDNSIVKKALRMKRSGWKLQRDMLATYFPESFGQVKDKKTGFPRDMYAKEYKVALQNLQEKIDGLHNIFTTTEMREGLQTNKTNPLELSETDKLKQAAYLLEYQKYNGYASAFSSFVNSLSVDTVSAKTLAENYLLLEKRAVASEQGFIANIDNAFENTFLGKMYNERLNFNKYLADKFVIANPKVQTHMIEAVKYIARKPFMSNDKIEKFVNRYQSFLLSYIVQNTEGILENGQAIKLNDRKFYDMFKSREDHNSLVDQMNTNKYVREQIDNKNAFFEAVAIMKAGENNNFDSIKLNNSSLDTYGLNNAAGQLNDFYNAMQRKAKNGDEEAIEASRIINRLVMYTILQSGLQTSPVNFSKLIHQDLYVKFINPIFNDFLANDNEELDPYAVWKQFHQNNWNNQDIVETFTARLQQGRDFNGIDDETGENLNDYENVFDRQGTTLQNGGRNFVTKVDDFIPHFVAVSVMDNYDMDSGKGGKRVKVLYELTDVNKDIATYTRINKLGDRMYMMETYGRDTKNMDPGEIYTTTIGVNQYIQESSEPTLVESKLKELTDNEPVNNNNGVSLQQEESFENFKEELNKKCD